MNSKFVIFGNGADWCYQCVQDYKRYTDCIIFNDKIPLNSNSFLYRIAKVHFSIEINKRVKLPFKSIWYKKFLRQIPFNANDKLFIIFYDRNRLANIPSFLKYSTVSYELLPKKTCVSQLPIIVSYDFS